MSDKKNALATTTKRRDNLELQSIFTFQKPTTPETKNTPRLLWHLLWLWSAPSLSFQHCHLSGHSTTRQNIDEHQLALETFAKENQHFLATKRANDFFPPNHEKHHFLQLAYPFRTAGDFFNEKIMVDNHRFPNIQAKEIWASLESDNPLNVIPFRCVPIEIVQVDNFPQHCLPHPTAHYAVTKTLSDHPLVSQILLMWLLSL